MTLASVTARRVHDDDASFWCLDCDTCDFHGCEYEGRAEALAAETWAIHNEGPLHNRELQPRYLPDASPEPTRTFDFLPWRAKQQKRLTAKIDGLVIDRGWEWVRANTNPDSWYEVA